MRCATGRNREYACAADIAHLETAGSDIGVIRCKLEVYTTDFQYFIVAITQPSHSNLHLGQISVVAIRECGNGSDIDRHVRDVGSFCPGNGIILPCNATIQVHNRRILSRSNGDRTGDCRGGQRRWATRIATCLGIVAVVDDDRIATRRVRVVNGRIVAGALVSQGSQNGFNLGNGGCVGEGNGESSASRSPNGCIDASQGSAIDEQHITCNAIGYANRDGAGAKNG